MAISMYASVGKKWTIRDCLRSMLGARQMPGNERVTVS